MSTSEKTPVQKPPLRLLIQDLMGLIDTFSNLLLRETQALGKADFASVDVLQPEKKTLARTYHDKVAALGGRSEEMTTLDLSLREKFIRARMQFTIILNDNMRALDAAKNSAGRLVARILDTARKTVIDENQTHYSAKAQTGSWKTAAMSLSIDRQL